MYFNRRSRKIDVKGGSKQNPEGGDFWGVVRLKLGNPKLKIFMFLSDTTQNIWPRALAETIACYINERRQASCRCRLIVRVLSASQVG